jgi:heme/copper-type cytochrome/quinol oxidase subunit 1
MTNLFLLLLAIFGDIAVLSLVLQRFASPMEPDKVNRISRWIYPLVGLALVLATARYFLQG